MTLSERITKKLIEPDEEFPEFEVVDFPVRGYLLNNGEWLSIGRGNDHRYINGKIYFPEKTEKSFMGQTDKMFYIMKKAGMIRFMPEANYLQILTKPTYEQRREIKNLLHEVERFWIEYGTNSPSFEYSSDYDEELVNDLENYDIMIKRRNMGGKMIARDSTLQKKSRAGKKNPSTSIMMETFDPHAFGGRAGQDWTIWIMEGDGTMRVLSWNPDKTHFVFYTASNSALKFATRQEAAKFIKETLIPQYNLPAIWKLYVRKGRSQSYHPVKRDRSLIGVSSKVTSREKSARRLNPITRDGNYSIISSVTFKDNTTGQKVYGKIYSYESKDKLWDVIVLDDGRVDYRVNERESKKEKMHSTIINHFHLYNLRENPEGIPGEEVESIHTRTEKRKAEGKRQSDSSANIAYLEKNAYRMQASIYLRNMIKALEIASYQNTVEEWKRYFDAKKLLRMKSRR